MKYEEFKLAMGRSLCIGANIEHVSLGQVDEDFARMIISKHEKYPLYVFMGTGAAYANLPNPTLSTFDVYYKNAVLGTVRSLAVVKQYILQNDMIRVAVPRVGEIRTKDIRRASRKFDKYIRPKSNDETFYGAVKQGREALLHAREAVGTDRYHYNAFVVTYFGDHIAKNFEHYRAIGLSNGASVKEIDTAYQRHSTWSAVEETSGGMSATFGYFLHLMEDKCYVTNSMSVGHRVYAMQDIPQKLRDKLGMLKLVVNNTHVRGVGFRCNDDTFFIAEKYDE
jgi:hypothetical protein